MLILMSMVMSHTSLHFFVLSFVASENQLLCSTHSWGKYLPKMIRPCDWIFETKVIIVCDSFFRKLFSIVYCPSLSLTNPVSIQGVPRKNKNY